MPTRDSIKLKQRALTMAVLLLVAAIGVGCKTARQVAARYPGSDIEAIYAAALPNPQRNPVVLVHGFAGATLRRGEDDATVWGTFFTQDSLLPSKQEGLKAFALDVDGLQPPVDSSQIVLVEDDTRAVELLQRAKADAGVMDVNVGIYAALVITNKALYLDKLWMGTPVSSPKIKNGLHPIPLKKPDDEPYLLASWFTGELRHYHGEPLGYTHQRTNVRVLCFKNGKLVSVRDEESELYTMLKMLTNSSALQKPSIRPQTNSLPNAPVSPTNPAPRSR